MTSARAMRRLGPGPLVLSGGVLFAASMLWRVGFVSVRPDYPRDLLPSMVLGGIGVGLAMGTLIAAGVTALPAHRSATGSALVNSNRQIASAVGVAILVTLLGAHPGVGSVGAFRLGWATATGLALLSAVTGVALAGLGNRPVPPPGAPPQAAPPPAAPPQAAPPQAAPPAASDPCRTRRRRRDRLLGGAQHRFLVGGLDPGAGDCVRSGVVAVEFAHNGQWWRAVGLLVAMVAPTGGDDHFSPDLNRGPRSPLRANAHITIACVQARPGLNRPGGSASRRPGPRRTAGPH
jgi:hypothetical protein